MDGRTVLTWIWYLGIMTSGWYLFGWVGIPLSFIVAFIIDRSFTNLLKQDIIDALTNKKDDSDD